MLGWFHKFYEVARVRTYQKFNLNLFSTDPTYLLTILVEKK
jgi:hypothetical protein